MFTQQGLQDGRHRGARLTLFQRDQRNRLSCPTNSNNNCRLTTLTASVLFTPRLWGLTVCNGGDTGHPLPLLLNILPCASLDTHLPSSLCPAMHFFLLFFFFFNYFQCRDNVTKQIHHSKATERPAGEVSSSLILMPCQPLRLSLIHI